jgi:predicted O-methyltransferase YrrM
MALTPVALISDPPHLHGVTAQGEFHDWALGPRALTILSEAIQAGWRTLETGAGVSTVLFALKQTYHTCVVPSSEEIARIQAFCSQHGISTSRLEFVEAASEEALPRLDPEPLDLVVIDGSHSFPSVFIDWYYTANRLKAGGWLFVDDTHLWTGRILRDFLRAEDAWTLVDEVPFRTAIFRKQRDVQSVRNWVYQPYVVSNSIFTRRRRVETMLRDRDWQMLLSKLARRFRRRPPR